MTEPVRMVPIEDILASPMHCQAHDALKMRDRRRGAIWFCPLARKIAGKGRKRPACLCDAALSSARAIRAAGTTEVPER